MFFNYNNSNLHCILCFSIAFVGYIMFLTNNTFTTSFVSLTFIGYVMFSMCNLFHTFITGTLRGKWKLGGQ